jgi:heterodisulfide reductase subunit D
MERNRENSRCCGAGSGVKSAYPETSLLVASRRIKDAEDTKAELIVTSCSFCILNLQNAIEHRMDDVDNGPDEGDKSSINKVLDISELILLGLEDEKV